MREFYEAIFEARMASHHKLERETIEWLIEAYAAWKAALGPARKRLDLYTLEELRDVLVSAARHCMAHLYPDVQRRMQDEFEGIFCLHGELWPEFKRLLAPEESVHRPHEPPRQTTTSQAPTRSRLAVRSRTS